MLNQPSFWKPAVWLLAGLAGLAGVAGAGDFSDEAVERAIERGAQYLWSQQKPDGGWEAYGSPNGEHTYNYHPYGPGALAIYALLACDANPQEERMKKALQWLAEGRDERTYTLGARCCVWQLANLKTNGQYKRQLTEDSRRLIRGGLEDGGYNYYALRTHGDNPGGPARFDNSNTQFGLLGVWMASLGRADVPNLYWRKSLRHWMSGQNRRGGWNYENNPKEVETCTMTASGVASLFVCADNLFAKKYIECKGQRELPAITRGLGWFDKNFEKTIEAGGNDNLCYYLYAVERVGLASGYKYFGKTDWYKLGSRVLMEKQSGNGSWGTVWDTAFAMLFLSRGRHPVLLNKLQYEGDWNNRPRALASLTYWASYTLEQTVNWQIINLKAPVSEWHDAVFLYLSGCQEPKFQEKDLKKLRTFVLQGGVLFSVAEGGAPGFAGGMRRVYRELFPEYRLEALPSNHPIYSAHYKLRGRPKLFMMTNGIRPIVLHTDEDLAVSWQTNAVSTQPQAFEMIVNLLQYVVGGVQDLRPRGISHWPSKDVFGGTSWTVKLARLRYKGNWDPEPLAYERLNGLMSARLWTKVEVDTVDVKDIAATQAKVAVLTGTGDLRLDEGEIAALKAYVDRGGTLVVDAAGGDRAFAKTARGIIETMYGSEALQMLAPTSPIYRLEDNPIDKVRFRRATHRRLGRREGPQLLGITVKAKNEYDEVYDRPAVLFSPEDITCGLVGYPSGVIDGYAPQSAFDIMRNILYFAGDVKTNE